jgi:hypothetical protein|tara:strand:- start:2404 stop:2646 length:243 start_codon:yes stop_codon:yes gene_type:complete
MTTNKTKINYSSLARWLCLYEAVNIISEKAEKMGSSKDCLKPIPINKYINERYHSVLKDIEYEYENEEETINNSPRKRRH